MSTSSPTPSSPKPRRKHAKAFKHEALRLAASIGVSAAAERLGINESMLYDWRRKAELEGADAFRGNGQRTEGEAELARLRRENEVLKMEREILKKATEFWVKECR